MADETRDVVQADVRTVVNSVRDAASPPPSRTAHASTAHTDVPTGNTNASFAAPIEAQRKFTAFPQSVASTTSTQITRNVAFATGGLFERTTLTLRRFMMR